MSLRKARTTSVANYQGHPHIIKTARIFPKYILCPMLNVLYIEGQRGPRGVTGFGVYYFRELLEYRRSMEEKLQVLLLGLTVLTFGGLARVHIQHTAYQVGLPL